MRKIEIYDTTLRDGSQSEDISFSLEDKLRIVERLDDLGIHYIEGGWPGSNPRDVEFFERVHSLHLKSSILVAFGSTRKAAYKAHRDPNLWALVKADTPVIAIFGKTWDLHVRTALRISLALNLDLIESSVSYLKKRVDRVFFDAEHFFDGYKNNTDYAMLSLQAAVTGGADYLVLCDTNGGTLPNEIEGIVKDVISRFSVPVSIHAHNDSECAVANSLAAVRAGASQVQGTINGLGERCGNANLISIIPNLMIKLKYKVSSTGRLRKLKDVSRFVAEIANIRHAKNQPFVGDSAFAHKAGIHVSAVMRNSRTYEHIQPEQVGNYQRILVSDLSGRSNILSKAREFNLKIDPSSPEVLKIIQELKDLESQGFQFEGAEASFELLMKKTFQLHRRFFELIGFRVIVEKRKEGEYPISEATIMLKVNGQLEHTAATGDGPVNAIDNALRKALEKFYPQLRDVRLLDYKVRVLTAGRGTAAKVRVLVESGDDRHKWGTVGVSENIIEASWQAIVDSIEYKLLRG